MSAAMKACLVSIAATAFAAGLMWIGFVEVFP